MVRFWSKVRKTTGCWEWTAATNADGYGIFWLGKRGRGGRMHQAHRVAYEAVAGGIPLGLHLDHLCRNRRCVNPAHLEPVTPRENSRRGLSLGQTWARGEKCGTSKLKAAQVREIRARYSEGAWTQRRLASAFGVSQSLVSLIIRGEYWAHLEAP